MKKITAILILFAFVAAQYAKQASYLECRLRIFFNTEAGKCDCEKIFSKSESSPLNDLSLPAVHSHIHIDDSYFPGKTIIQHVSFCNFKLSLRIREQDDLQNGFCFIADRPPQLG